MFGADNMFFCDNCQAQGQGQLYWLTAVQLLVKFTKRQKGLKDLLQNICKWSGGIYHP